VFYIRKEELKKTIKKQQETIQKLTEELIESNSGMVALTLELEKAQEEYQNIFENSILGIYKTTGDNRFKIVNPKMAKILGYDTPEELIDNIDDIDSQIYASSDERDDFKILIEKYGSISDFELKIYDKDGNQKWILENTRLLTDQEGRFKGYEGIVQDITERKKIEELEKRNYELGELNKKLEKSKKMYREAYNRAEFYKDIFAHDISNILQGIFSGMQLCEIKLKEPGEIKNNINIIKNQIMRGANLVTNIRNLSKIKESGLELEKRNIFKDLKKSVAFMKNVFPERKKKIQIDSINDKYIVQANNFLKIMFDNILFNAVQHNKNHLVEIKIRITRENRRDINYLKIEFLDNGKGIKDNHKEEIFKRGYNEIGSIHGTGLGLSVVKKIIETYNGEIWVEDRIKGDYTKGSTFIILIPEVN